MAICPECDGEKVTYSPCGVVITCAKCNGKGYIEEPEEDYSEPPLDIDACWEAHCYALFGPRPSY